LAEVRTQERLPDEVLSKPSSVNKSKLKPPAIKEAAEIWARPMPSPISKIMFKGFSIFSPITLAPL
jgi:hypothetical protein